jgi:hypothetical protein
MYRAQSARRVSVVVITIMINSSLTSYGDMKIIKITTHNSNIKKKITPPSSAKMRLFLPAVELRPNQEGKRLFPGPRPATCAPARWCYNDVIMVLQWCLMMLQCYCEGQKHVQKAKLYADWNVDGRACVCEETNDDTGESTTHVCVYVCVCACIFAFVWVHT